MLNEIDDKAASDILKLDTIDEMVRAFKKDDDNKTHD
jgi:hypothetical protein